jgi:hypothetical protein
MERICHLEIEIEVEDPPAIDLEEAARHRASCVNLQDEGHLPDVRAEAQTGTGAPAPGGQWEVWAIGQDAGTAGDLHRCR